MTLRSNPISAHDGESQEVKRDGDGSGGQKEAVKEKRRTLYFAYGSNLSLEQMKARCPESRYVGLGVLRGWRWIIGPRGYANVVRCPSSPSSSSTSSSSETPDWNTVVYGMLYYLSDADEEALDLAEGVPDSYEKVWLDVEVVRMKWVEREEGKKVDALVYVDYRRVEDGVCKEEYVARMNRGIIDAVREGMPRAYVDTVMRKWVPDRELPKEGVKDPFFREGYLMVDSQGVTRAGWK